MRRVLLSLALCAYPRDFRSAYRSQILSDIDEANSAALFAALNLIGCGLAMRLESFLRDAAYALRRLRRMPLFATIVAATFALGIGANVAVFSVLNAVLLKPLPYANIDRLVAFRERSAHEPGIGTSLSIPEVDDFASQSSLLRLVSASSPDGATLTGAGKPRALNGNAITPQYFAALGVRPQIGRFFTEADEREGVSSAIISDRLWRGSFAADPRIIGRTMRLNGLPYTIVGVAPRGLLVPDAQRGSLQPLDYWLVQPDRAPPNQRGSSYLGVIAVLQPHASLAAVNAELATISKRLQRRYPDYESGQTYFVEPLTTVVFGGVSEALWTLFAAVLGILVITCANIANMLLTNASTRDREFALRAALGASRRRITEQLLIETGALALLGGVLGVGLAYGMLAALRPALEILPHIEDLRIDLNTLAYALGIVLTCTLLAGLWPVAALRYKELHATLKAAGRGATGAAGHRLRAGLVVSEIAVALALVVLSGLMLRSYITLINSDLGVKPQGVVATTVIGLPEHTYASLPARANFDRQLLDRLHAIPGVDSAALAVTYPLAGINMMFQIGIVGRQFAPGQEPSLSENTITPEYFRTLGVPVLRGRAFTDQDNSSSRPVAIVNETFSRLYGLNGDTLGMQIKTAGWNGTARATRTIVGIVADERVRLQDAPRPEYYVPMQQGPANLLEAIVRSGSVPAATLAAQLRNAVSATDPSMAAPDTHTFPELIAQHSQEQRSIVTLLVSLALIALLLALFGIFGVISYSVNQRYTEFGIRVALGARSTDVLADVLVNALKITLVGAAIGLGVAALAAKAIASQLYQVSPLDPATFAVVVALIVTCAAIAALLPAARATRIQPAAVLRYE